MLPAKKDLGSRTFFLAPMTDWVNVACFSCLPLGSCDANDGLSIVRTWPSISTSVVSLDPSFLLRCTSCRVGVDIVLLLLVLSLLLPFVMVIASAAVEDSTRVGLVLEATYLLFLWLVSDLHTHYRTDEQSNYEAD